jgi:hypothetical protein
VTSTDVRAGFAPGHLVRLPRAAAPEIAPCPPRPRGPLTEALISALRGPTGPLRLPLARGSDPVRDDDEACALYLCFELTYRGLAGVDDRWEHEPSLIGFRRHLEDRLAEAIRSSVPAIDWDGSVVTGIRAALAADDSPSVSAYLEQAGTIRDFCEFAIHRSAYQLKEADPHTWAIPRLSGTAKAAMVKIQSEEYGDGVASEMHATLFADTMRELGLDATYGAYLERIPGSTLSGVNVISMFGLNRRWRGALAGHLVGFEMTSVGPNARYARAARRLGLSEPAVRFFDVHVDADEEHQVVAEERLAVGLATAEPQLAADIVFGAQALCAVEGAFSTQVTSAWSQGRSSLLR